MASKLGDPAYWRARAEEARTQASEMKDPRARQTLLDIAENYDQLAEQQERLAHSAPMHDRER
jgi:hypothetical protein